jgi:DNA-binding transcriptional LysR family regulator
MAKTLDLQRLSHFVYVAELGSFSKAAAVLSIAQSALSRQMVELETEFGARLLHRTGRGAVPTEFAQRILPRVRALLLEAEQLSADIEAARGTPTGQVNLAVLASLGTSLLTPLLSRISERLPGIQMRVLEGLTDHIDEWLVTGRVDIGVLYGKRRNPAAGDEPLFSTRLYQISAPGEQPQKTGTVPFTLLAKLPMILPGVPNGLRVLLDDISKTQEVSLEVVLEIDSVATIKELVALGNRHTILPLYAVQREVRNGALIAAPIKQPEINRTILMAVSTQRPMSRATGEVAGVIRQLAKELTAEGSLSGVRGA